MRERGEVDLLRSPKENGSRETAIQITYSQETRKTLAHWLKWIYPDLSKRGINAANIYDRAISGKKVAGLKGNNLLSLKRNNSAQDGRESLLLMNILQKWRKKGVNLRIKSGSYFS